MTGGEQQIALNLEKEIKEIVRLLEKLPNGAFSMTDRKEVLSEAAVPVIEAAKALAPRSEEVHYMYKTGHKISGKLKSPKGQGIVSAVFQPGNLSNSIQILKHGPFRRSPYVYVGPRYPRFGRISKRMKVAPYAHMVEFGTAKQRAQPYMRPAFEATKAAAFRIAKAGFRKKLDAWVAKNKMK